MNGISWPSAVWYSLGWSIGILTRHLIWPGQDADYGQWIGGITVLVVLAVVGSYEKARRGSNERRL